MRGHILLPTTGIANLKTLRSLIPCGVMAFFIRKNIGGHDKWQRKKN